MNPTIVNGQVQAVINASKLGISGHDEYNPRLQQVLTACCVELDNKEYNTNLSKSFPSLQNAQEVADNQHYAYRRDPQPATPQYSELQDSSPLGWFGFAGLAIGFGAFLLSKARIPIRQQSYRQACRVCGGKKQNCRACMLGI
jgi:hypothetical protein